MAGVGGRPERGADGGEVAGGDGGREEARRRSGGGRATRAARRATAVRRREDFRVSGRGRDPKTEGSIYRHRGSLESPKEVRFLATRS